MPQLVELKVTGRDAVTIWSVDEKAIYKQSQGAVSLATKDLERGASSEKIWRDPDSKA